MYCLAPAAFINLKVGTLASPCTEKTDQLRHLSLSLSLFAYFCGYRFRFAFPQVEDDFYPSHLQPRHCGPEGSEGNEGLFYHLFGVNQTCSDAEEIFNLLKAKCKCFLVRYIKIVTKSTRNPRCATLAPSSEHVNFLYVQAIVV